MAFDQVRLDRPLSRLEMILMFAIIATLAGWFMHRLSYLEAVAESRALAMTVRSLRTGLMVNVAIRLIKGDETDIVALSQSNPVGTIIDAPPGYLGAIRGVNPDNIQPGQWYFDEDARALVYRIVNTDFFEGPGDGTAARVRIRLKLNYDDRNRNHAYDPGVDAASGVGLQVLDPLQWKF